MYNDLLRRRFDRQRPNRFRAADAACIPTPGGMPYLCAVIDLCGGMVLSWQIGADMTSSLVADTVREALMQEKVTDRLALCCDQGTPYT